MPDRVPNRWNNVLVLIVLKRKILTSRLSVSPFLQRGMISFLSLVVAAIQLSGCNSESTKVVSSPNPTSSAPPIQPPPARVQTHVDQTPVTPTVSVPAKPISSEKRVTTPQSASKAIEANPLDADAYFERAKSEKIAKDYGSAVRDLEKTIELRPEYYEAHMYLAYLYADMRNFKQALVEYDKAGNLRPEDFNAWEGRAWMQNQLHQYAEAAKSAKRAIELNPKTTGNVREFLAGSYNALGDYRHGLEACNEGIKYKPHSDWLYQMRAQAEDRLDELPAAIKDYKKAIEMNPKAWNWLYPGLVSCYDRYLKEKDLN
jgi:Tfp pilus assembly protein PilF